MHKKSARSWVKHLDFMVLDIVCMYIAFFLAYVLRYRVFHSFESRAYNGLLVCLTLANILTALFYGTYSEVLKRGYYIEFQKTIKQDVTVFLLAVCYLYLGGSGEEKVSRLLIGFLIILYIVLSYCTRSVWKFFLKKRLSEEKKSLLVVTLRENAQALVKKLQEENLSGFRIKGLILLEKEGEEEKKQEPKEINGIDGIDGIEEIVGVKGIGGIKKIDEIREAGGLKGIDEIRGIGEPSGIDRADGIKEINKMDEAEKIEGIPVVASREDAAEYVCREWVDEILVSIPSGGAYPRELISDFIKMGIVVHVNLSELFESYGKKQALERMGDMTVWTFSIGSIDGMQLFLKRMTDILLGLLGSMVTVILTLVIGPLIYIHSPGPVFFSQTRIGRNGRKFQIYKFRSMYPDAEERKKELESQSRVKGGLMFKMDYDPRIIGCRILPDGTVKKGIGNFIRDWSLDEFPQFFNVLKGEMSVVGTRPPTEDEWEKYEFHHRQRLSFQPGITGLWQVSGRSNITDFEEVVRLDTEYIEDWNIGKDIRIIFRTIGAVLRRKGAR